MLFQLVLTKFFKSELFSCLPKIDHVIKSCKEPIGTDWDLFSDEPLRGLILMKCILGDRLRAVPFFVLLAEFGNFHQLCFSSITLLYHL